MAEHPHGEDPGWFSSTSLLALFVPVLGLRRALREASNVLQELRALFTTFAAALVLIPGLVVALSTGDGAEGVMPVSAVAVGVAGFGVLSLFAPHLVKRPLDCSSPEALTNTYRTRFFLRIAFAESAAMIGFVGFFVAEEWWIYPLGAFFALLGFMRLAPTRPNLDRDQEELNLAGCGLSLIGALTTTGD